MSGSLANGDADEFSDLDLVVLADEPLIDAARRVIETVEDIIIAYELPPGGTPFILSVVTSAWHRVDIAFASDPPPGTLPVYPADLEVAPAVEIGPPEPNAESVSRIVAEFFRILGLSVVVLGRGDVHAAREGADLLRRHLIDILLLDGRKSRPGPKKLRNVLSDEQQFVLRSLPSLRDDERAVREFSAAVDDVFTPRARTLLESLDGEWPAEVESATRRYLERGRTDP